MSSELVGSLSYEDYLAGTAQVLELNRQETEPKVVKIAGKWFVILPDVFSPVHFQDPFAEWIKFRRERFLEIGPGPGHTSVLAALAGSRVVSIGVNPREVKNTRANTLIHGVGRKVTARIGDVFTLKNGRTAGDLIPGGNYDTIFWNTPFGYVPGNRQLSLLERAVFDPAYEATRRYIREAERYLVPCGASRLLIGFSSTLGRMDLLEQLLHNAGYRFWVVREGVSTEVHPIRFELIEARRRTGY